MPQDIISRQLNDITEDQVVNENGTLDEKSTVCTTYNRLLRSISRDEEGDEEDDDDEETIDPSKLADLRRSSILSYISTTFSLSDEDATNSESEVDCNLDLTVAKFESKLNHAMEAMQFLINNQYIEGWEKFDEYSSTSLYHALGKVIMTSALVLATFKKSKAIEALQEIKQIYPLINKYRLKRSTAKSMVAYVNIFRNHYNDFNDIQCHAELVLATVTALDSLSTIISDQSLRGMVRAALKIRSSHRQFIECEKIAQNKSKWSSIKCRDWFNSGIQFCLGTFEMVISFFPTRFIKLIQLAGFSGNRDVSLDYLLSAFNLKNTFMHPWTAVMLALYYGFLEYFYGLGEPNVEMIQQMYDYYRHRTPNSVAVKVGAAFLASYHGDFDASLTYYDQFIQGQTIVKKFHNVSYWQKMWLHAVQWNWDEASQNAKILSDTWKLSPATFAYLYGCCRAMQLDELLSSGVDETSSSVIQLKQEVNEYFNKVPKLKRNFGGKKAFHEKLVYENSLKYITQGHLIMPILDVMYIWNIFKIASYKPSCLQNILHKIDCTLKLLPQSIDDETNYRLIFMKGVCLSNLNETSQALECFYQITDCNKLSTSCYLVPQSLYEIALIFRRSGDNEQAILMLEKCISNFSNYLTESMLNYRAHLVIKSIKGKKK